ncbi:MAG: hypothetical protein HC767_11715 [Akkermansiaceae bacterium]|nr:hypothetical protein [Akkermansiaceae bacterium]
MLTLSVQQHLLSVQDALQVRQLLTKGQLEEAQNECHTVTEGHITTLLGDPEAWKEYVAGWELTRKYAVSQAAIDVSGPSSKVCPYFAATLALF